MGLNQLNRKAAIDYCTQNEIRLHALNMGQGGQMIAEEYGVSLLAELPLEIGVRVSSDQGIPLVQIESSAALGARYHALASAVQTAMSAQGDATGFPTIEIIDD